MRDLGKFLCPDCRKWHLPPSCSAQTRFTAVKAVYDRRSRGYCIEALKGDEQLVMLAHDGYLVFDNAADTLDKVRAGVLIPTWGEVKRSLVIEFLKATIGGQR